MGWPVRQSLSETTTRRGPSADLGIRGARIVRASSDWIFAEFLPIDFEFERDLFEVSIVADRRPLRARKWEVPDILAVSLKRYPYVPGVQMEVILFEVKRKANAFDLHSIFEAVSHSKFAHRTYYCFEWTDITFRHIPEYQRLAQEAQVHGIGLIRAWFDDDRKRSIIPEIVLDARPVLPEPSVLNSVIDDLCPKETKAKMLEYLEREKGVRRA